MSNYILICTDTTGRAGERLSARAVAESRLRECCWPLYQQTAHRKVIRPGDRVVIYIGGTAPGARCFIAQSMVSAVFEMGPLRHQRPVDGQTQKCIATSLELTRPIVLAPPVLVADVFPRLSIAPSTAKHWGTALMGGMRRISDGDWDMIVGI
jgi:hypothetical protein